ncbi:hypothetical protein CC2G_001728 [Coprinopsis cinerea AmutBmut pab1-1]|nr:hypothetical protein CC2G_001728 [Coprinopsis cinerea AmutBmut pab1-1]
MSPRIPSDLRARITPFCPRSSLPNLARTEKAVKDVAYLYHSIDIDVSQSVDDVPVVTLSNNAAKAPLVKRLRVGSQFERNRRLWIDWYSQSL